MKIPNSVWEKGFERLRSAIVAQFVGKPPPFRVVAAPLDMSPSNTPEWITLTNVPPAAITLEGISWLTSMLGKPWKNFIREGLDVKVCVLRDAAVPCPETLVIESEEGESWCVGIIRATARDYKGTRKIWSTKEGGTRAVQAEKECHIQIPEQSVVVQNAIESGIEKEDPIRSPEHRVPIEVAQVTPLAEVEEQRLGLEGDVTEKGRMSKTLKRRLERKKKKSAQKTLTDSLNNVVTPDDEEELIDGTKGSEEKEIQHEDASLPVSSPMIEEEEHGMDCEIRKWTSADERDAIEGKTASKLAKSAEQLVQRKEMSQSFVQRVSGVKTRHKNKYR
ncbi:hypothetical protein LINPERPRIM_LOCUS31329 [Linum perenne]